MRGSNGTFVRSAVRSKAAGSHPALSPFARGTFSWWLNHFKEVFFWGGGVVVCVLLSYPFVDCHQILCLFACFFISLDLTRSLSLELLWER